MNPGAVEEAGSTARTLIGSLGANPLGLAMVVINLALIGYLYYEGVTVNEQRKGELALLYQNRREVGLLLAGCHWPEGVPFPKSLDHD